MWLHRLLFLCLIVSFTASIQAQKKSKNETPKAENKTLVSSSDLSAFKFRSLGPALTSGRIADLLINPDNNCEYYVAVASGGVWKTTDCGIRYTPLFDGEGSYSIGCLAMDPKNKNVIWVGTGENNNQRSVAYGDGVYKSEDGGKSWKNMGLKTSEHIGRIAIDPQNPNIVYVAAYGPLWTSGGERGIYKTEDGGKNWKRVLHVSDHTGFNEIMIDPRYPNILYAAAHQRQRKVFAYVGGGPESALYKSTDGGETWNKLNLGLPAADIGRIGINMYEANPDILYAVVEANEGAGVYRSKDRGASWEKRSGYSTSGNYYQKIYVDPVNPDKVFVMNTYLGVSSDGGKNFSILGEKNKHIDNHAMWINPKNTEHYLVGCDGGIYESFDGGKHWDFKQNLPVTQFYKVSTDNASPFYHIHGGTQDNFSIGGPSRTLSANGIMNSDWYFTSIGDGFETQVDPTDPNVIYAQAQYGYLSRYDRKSGEYLDIKPQERVGEAAYRWNWDSPLQLSHFDHKRLYFAANKVFRSDDRGNSWQVISEDLSRQDDRNTFELMGKVWSVDAIAKNGSTDIYGNLCSFSESPLDEQVLWAGSDDGLLHVTSNGGKSWTRIQDIPGVPERCYVHQIVASRHQKNTAYVAFNHHRFGDFRPYIYMTSDLGKTWKAIQSNLPERGSVYTVAEDHLKADLLFTGTEFGVFFSLDQGNAWIQLKAGLPTIAVRDIEIQRRENDLVLGTFGRGFYVLDNYSPLRSLSKSELEKEANIFPVKDSWMYIQSIPLGVRGKGFQGERFFTSENPKPEVVFYYSLKEDIKTLKEKRKAREKELEKKSQTVYYPSIDSLRLEDEEVSPHLLFTIQNESGEIVRRLKTSAKKGIHKLSWDMRTAAFNPVNFESYDEAFVFNPQEFGYMALPGTYTIKMSKFENGVYYDMPASQSFIIKTLHTTSLPPADKVAIESFSKKLSAMRIMSSSVNSYRSELDNKLKYIQQALIESPSLPLELSATARGLKLRLNKVNTILNGDQTKAKREFETLPSVNGIISGLVFGLWSTSSAPTQTFVSSLDKARSELRTAYDEIRSIDLEVTKIEKTLNQSNTPYTPGRLPDWIDE